MTSSRTDAWQADEYTKYNTNQVDSARTALSYVQDRLPETSGQLADVGCGAGEIAHEFARRGVFVDASDHSQSMVEATATACAGLNVVVRNQDANALELTPNGFHIVHCSWVLHWLDNYRHTLNTMSNAVKPGGALVLQWSHSRPDDPGCDIIDAFREVADSSKWSDLLAMAPLRNRQHRTDQVVAVIEAAGLSVDSIDTDLWPAAPAGSQPDLSAIVDRIRATGFAEQEAVLGNKLNDFITEGLKHAIATGRTDPGDTRLIAYRPEL